ncbi:aminopeptidase N [Alteromonas sp. 5E99-2]|uniref:aminopeptidase N n=1 Tax=Alteromonas sp. 5E99-2 TaxID=2817683 RepID=UPI001A99BA74|nr:aminopeptidase N [Alteromonas sp. 5E99-2]MBO1255034.1 aminopeptidase N [Alteromonas sp. 5E99-2]
MKSKLRLDYLPPEFTITDVSLDITLHPTETCVVSELRLKRVGKNTSALVLDGKGMSLNRLELDGQSVAPNRYSVNEEQLVINDVPDSFVLKVVTTVNPQENKALEGLYLTNGAYCTQCEAEGFRHITYYLDRPDVLATFTVSVNADAEKFPYLLSNGNKVSETVEGGVRTVVWYDPFPKPCYLFALVGGDFDVLRDTFTTLSGREIALELFVDKGQLDKSEFAMEALKRAMKWDEDTFGLEYDLDIYMIVAVDFFNMGAMENKGLNVFNSKFILANDRTATDTDYFNIEAVVAHEYFHNWTGNRVTCRDWFQLSLKEGLTVFRDQLFSADMTSELSTRIDQVKMIKEHQFPEDASAMSHPIRPDEVMEMNNFYTVTVYDKGAEVIRMLWNIIGEKAFKAGINTYFARFDGQAVTCDDFVDAMQSETSIDLSHFRLWYSQSGTPKLTVELNENNRTLCLSQHTPKTADQATKQAIPILLDYRCYDEKGQNLPLDLPCESTTQLDRNKFLLNSDSAVIRIGGMSSLDKVTTTFNANFSSPIIVERDVDVDSLARVALYDTDSFNRWDAIQELYNYEVSCVEQGASTVSKQFDSVFSAILQQGNCKEETAEFLSLPSVESLIQKRLNVDVEVLCNARSKFISILANTYYEKLVGALESIDKQVYSYNNRQVSARRLRKSILSIVAHDKRSTQIIKSTYEYADNMTDTLSALSAAQCCALNLFDELMIDFESKWKDDSLVIDKWFALHATAERTDILSQLTLLQEHPVFNKNNPNRVRSLIGSFGFYNKLGFHKKDGSGYKFLTDYLLKLDGINPQVAARMVTPLTQFQNLAQCHEQEMRKQLSRLINHKDLSKDVFEKVSKALAYGQKS